MELSDYLFLFLLIAAAAVILYRAIRKRKWCPDIFGGKQCGLDHEKNESEVTKRQKK